MYAGEFGFAVKPPLDPCDMPCAPVLGIWPGLLGSGKFGTPCARMHSANASGLGLPLGLAAPFEVVEDFASVPVAVVALVCCTVPSPVVLLVVCVAPLPDEPPQPAISAETIATANSRPTRRARWDQHR